MIIMDHSSIGQLVKKLAAVKPYPADDTDHSLRLPTYIDDDLLSHIDNPIGDLIRGLVAEVVSDQK